MNPYTLALVILLVIVACAEVLSFHRMHSVRRYAKTARSQNRSGFALLLVLLPIALVTWTAGWVLGQKRVCDQIEVGPKCVWKTGTTLR